MPSTKPHRRLKEFPRLAPSGVRVIVVGAGFGGLAAAIECDRKGHQVTLFEKAADIAEVQRAGDIISFDPNGSVAFERWPGVVPELRKIMRDTDYLDLFDWEGRFVTRQSFKRENEWGLRINGHRGVIHSIIYNHAVERGIDIRLGSRVTDYFEDDEVGGIVVNGEERFTADVVISSEGVRSRGRKIVLGFEDNPQSSGYAVYRAWFPADRVANNATIRHLCVSGDTTDEHHHNLTPQHLGYIGKDIHFLASSIASGTEVNWVFTHIDDGNIEESWQFPGKVSEALSYLQGWCPFVRELVAATPDGAGCLIDHKLVYRDPLPTFISPKARIALIGDAAHPFLPTSIQGASQSIEDGTTMAVCLEIGGRDNVTEAVRTYEKIRYERVHKAQATGVSTRERWHKANWDDIRKNPESLHLVREEWLLKFNAEEHAYEVYHEVAEKLRAEREKGVSVNGIDVAVVATAEGGVNLEDEKLV
ncbi:hypothetical protein MCOR12_006889 [Pyricularia oryzae]|uniref:FAD/NAD(P)-binding domain-containing protein n=1 Tax=Pyricularia grisea TaxID=148305 RepID=A0ABQ8NGR8_PYRGI|nr:hypothetical protein MCOR33_006998 [Pyricularia grisea]KAI6398048.1 hypothetical protein MCOR20_009351 [Pyricularia oryzae]KAI6405340.1 hypothetical protein MCOR24_007884 [Pyricularia oryzae]KAI6489810.1 hypothetical protein MCOR11_007748 [Pyricularia oryzae]KAI6594406.1 hypothetical protein MCOR12_006889 [Pyricularia oryzae]